MDDVTPEDRQLLIDHLTVNSGYDPDELGHLSTEDLATIVDEEPEEDDEDVEDDEEDAYEEDAEEDDEDGESDEDMEDGEEDESEDFEEEDGDEGDEGYEEDDDDEEARDPDYDLVDNDDQADMNAYSSAMRAHVQAAQYDSAAKAAVRGGKADPKRYAEWRQANAPLLKKPKMPKNLAKYYQQNEDFGENEHDENEEYDENMGAVKPQIVTEKQFDAAVKKGKPTMGMKRSTKGGDAVWAPAVKPPGTGGFKPIKNAKQVAMAGGAGAKQTGGFKPMKGVAASGLGGAAAPPVKPPVMAQPGKLPKLNEDYDENEYDENEYEENEYEENAGQVAGRPQFKGLDDPNKLSSLPYKTHGPTKIVKPVKPVLPPKFNEDYDENEYEENAKPWKQAAHVAHGAMGSAAFAQQLLPKKTGMVGIRPIKNAVPPGMTAEKHEQTMQERERGGGAGPKLSGSAGGSNAHRLPGGAGYTGKPPPSCGRRACPPTKPDAGGGVDKDNRKIGGPNAGRKTGGVRPMKKPKDDIFLDDPRMNEEPSVNEWLASAPPEIQQAVVNAMEVEQAERERVVADSLRFVTNGEQRQVIGDWLMQKSLPELKLLAQLLPPRSKLELPNAPNFIGANGGALTANRLSGGNDYLPMPRLFSDEEIAARKAKI